MKTTLLIWGSIFISVSHLYAQTPAQSVINTSGNTFKSSGYQVDWSIGETALVTEMRPGSGEIIITNGFLQPYTPISPDPLNGFGPEEIRVLPNPTYDIVEINLLTPHQGKAVMEIYDVSGKVLIRRDVVIRGYGHLEYISLGAYAAGTYYLRINLTPAQGFSRKTGSYKIMKL
jgi:hypothetical protein